MVGDDDAIRLGKLDLTTLWMQSDYATETCVESPRTDAEVLELERRLGYKLS